MDVVAELTRHAGVLQQLYSETEQGCDIRNAVMRMITNEHEVTLMLQKLIQGEPDRVMQVVNSMSRSSGQNPGGNRKGIMEFKVIQNLKAVTGDKTGFRQWHQKFMSALGQVNSRYEELMKNLITKIDLDKDLTTVIDQEVSEEPQQWDELSKDLYKVLIDKAEGEAYDKIKMVQPGDGMKAYGVLYRWFTEVSGLGLVEQSRRLMHPEPVKREEELSEAVEAWMDKLRRLEAHGEKYKLPAVYKLTALKAMLTGKALEYAELWEADLDKIDEDRADKIEKEKAEKIAKDGARRRRSWRRRRRRGRRRRRRRRRRRSGSRRSSVRERRRSGSRRSSTRERRRSGLRISSAGERRRSGSRRSSARERRRSRSRIERELLCIDRKVNSEVCEVNVPGWERVRVQVDSGAVDTAVPRETARAFAVRPTEMSKKGIGFIAANGSKISSYGEKKVSGWTDEGVCMSMRMTCADVKKPSCSVYRMNLGGNVVVFDGNRSCMQNKMSGRKARIRCENGQYVFDLRVQASGAASDKGQKGSERPGVSTSNRFQVLSPDNEEGEKREAVFMRRALSQ